MSETQQTHKYQMIHDNIRNDIILRKYAPETLLPTEGELMAQYQVSRNTIRQALKLLQDEGYVITRRGSGSMVCAERYQKSRSPFQPWQATHVTIEYKVEVQRNEASPAVLDTVPSAPYIAAGLGIPAGENVYRVQRIWYINGTPYNYMIQYVNPALMPELPQHINEDRNIAVLMEKHWDLHVVDKLEHLSCRSAGFVEAGLLNVEVGKALMYSQRVGTCEKGVYEFTEFYGNPEYIGYLVRID